MVARGWIARTEVEAALFDAATACGLVADDGEAQTRRTIAIRTRRRRRSSRIRICRTRTRCRVETEARHEATPALQPGRRPRGFQKMAGR